MTADDRARRTARFPEAAAARTADAAARARRAITRLHATGQPITSSRWPAPREYRPVFCISTPNFGAKSASTVYENAALSQATARNSAAPQHNPRRHPPDRLLTHPKWKLPHADTDNPSTNSLAPECPAPDSATGVPVNIQPG
jgi:hypothetical protein